MLALLTRRELGGAIGLSFASTNLGSKGAFQVKRSHAALRGLLLEIWKWQGGCTWTQAVSQSWVLLSAGLL